MIRIHAPGKVVLLGEYAVLDDAPAIVAAVDRGIEGTWDDGPEKRILAPDDRFVGPALRDAPPGTYSFHPWNPPPTPTKAGLGSSAAATVAAVYLAAMARGSSVDPDSLFARAVAVHHRVQGSGSGIDVAASARGGVLRYQSGESVQVAIDLDDRLAVAWVGSSAATAPRVAAYKALADRSSFVQLSSELVSHWTSDPIAAFADAAALLADLDRRAGLGWWVPAYQPLFDLAKDHGGAAKPSGAGGGDVIVAMFPDRDRRDAFLAAVPRAGGVPLPCRIAPGAGATP